MLIGEVAERTGLTQRTLRYYEEIGLLPPAPRLEGGFRLYTEADLQRLEHIKELKRLLGFSLLEIKEMVEAEEERRELRQAYRHEADPAARRAKVARALEIAWSQMAKLDQHLQGLEQLRRQVESRIERYQAELRAMVAQEEGTRATGLSEGDPLATPRVAGRPCGHGSETSHGKHEGTHPPLRRRGPGSLPPSGSRAG